MPTMDVTVRRPKITPTMRKIQMALSRGEASEMMAVRAKRPIYKKEKTVAKLRDPVPAKKFVMKVESVNTI